MAQIKSDSKLCTYTHVQKPVIFPDTSVMNYNLMSWPMVLSSKSIFTSHFKCFPYIMLLLLYKSSNLVDYILDRGFITSIQTEEVGGCEIIHCYAVKHRASQCSFQQKNFCNPTFSDWNCSRPPSFVLLQLQNIRLSPTPFLSSNLLSIRPPSSVPHPSVNIYQHPFNQLLHSLLSKLFLNMLIQEQVMRQKRTMGHYGD